MKAGVCTLAFGVSAFCLPRGSTGQVPFVEDLNKNFVLYAKGQPTLTYTTTKRSFSVTGSPIVQRNSEGLQVSSNKMSGSFFAEPNGAYNLDTVLAEGDAVLTYDSNRAIAFQKASGGPGSQDADVVTILKSQTIAVSRQQENRVVNLEHPFDFTDARPLSDSKGVYDRRIEVTGASGVFTFNMPSEGAPVKPLTGEAAGPVHLHSTKSLRGSSLAPEVLDVTGDHFTVDMTKQQDQLVLEGHVHWTYSVMQQRGNCLRVVASIDPGGTITNLVATGEPATTVVVPVGAPR